MLSRGIICCVALTGEIFGELVLEPFRSTSRGRLNPGPAVRRRCLGHISAILGSQMRYLNLIARQLRLMVCFGLRSSPSRGVVFDNRAVSLGAVSHTAINLHTVRWGQITVFSGLRAALLAHFQTLVDIAHIDRLQLKLLPTGALSRLVV